MLVFSCKHSEAKIILEAITFFYFTKLFHCLGALVSLVSVLGSLCLSVLWLTVVSHIWVFFSIRLDKYFLMNFTVSMKVCWFGFFYFFHVRDPTDGNWITLTSVHLMGIRQYHWLTLSVCLVNVWSILWFVLSIHRK